GPNGLAAAIAMAQRGRSVTIYEAQPTIGGGVRSAELTLPGFIHDTCSAVYPLAVGSPFFATLPLEQHGLKWVEPPVPLAHPLDDGTAILLERSVDATAKNLGIDGEAYRNLMGPLVENWPALSADILAPWHWPSRPFSFARFGLRAIRPARGLAEKIFQGERAQALFAGLAAHSMLPLEYPASAAFGLILGATAHTVGWPIARGGAQKLTDALASYFRILGGTIISNKPVTSLEEFPRCRIILCDLTPRQLLKVAGDRFSARYRRSLERYHYGMGAFKVDWALSGPVPWKAPACARAATVHLGGCLSDIAASERSVWAGAYAEQPFVLLVQPSLFDRSRAPGMKHTLWSYCHVPNGSSLNMLEKIEAQIERFAPGFRDLVLARSVRGPLELQKHNANLVGGDINGGAPTLRQLFLRPTFRRYKTSVRGLYICSASTPPGGGVHGMCGYLAACQALEEIS
ncbi:MAG TPA: NAD(P)/FAD-dependent oxidoreductase, partial [Terriglobales bacterium]|nr:NAD(P)/FAD-dependent oxidoreductase [Terriglobales bacterium]